MLTQPWAVAAWPQVFWGRRNVSGQKFAHLATQVLPPVEQIRGRRGQTIWWANLDSQDGAIAWDWVEVRGGVVSLVDPMAVMSNIEIEESDHHADTERIIVLNEWVHQIPWQNVVNEALRMSEA